jgi:hypothetical protein
MNESKKVYRLFPAGFLFGSPPHPSILKMEAMRTSETLGESYRTTRRYTVEDIHCHENHRFSNVFPFFRVSIYYNLTTSQFGI